MKNYKDLTIEELELVFDNNEKLRGMAYQEAIKDMDNFINEDMSCFSYKAIDYNIGYPGSYINVIHWEEFIEGCKKLQRNYNRFTEAMYKKVLYVERLFEKWQAIPYNDDNNNERIEKRIQGLVNEVCAFLLKEYESWYSYYTDNENLKEYFIDIFSERFGEGKTLYLDENYILYEHIEKSYK